MDQLTELIQKELNIEQQTVYNYMAAYGYFKYNNWHGLARWFWSQIKEEKKHTKKFINYLNDRHVMMQFRPIEPLNLTGGPLEVVSNALGFMDKVTANLKACYAEADRVGDTQTSVFLDPFLEDQTKGTEEYRSMVGELNRIGSDMAALMIFDKKYHKKA